MEKSWSPIYVVYQEKNRNIYTGLLYNDSWLCINIPRIWQWVLLNSCPHSHGGALIPRALNNRLLLSILSGKKIPLHWSPEMIGACRWGWEYSLVTWQASKLSFSYPAHSIFLVSFGNAFKHFSQSVMIIGTFISSVFIEYLSSSPQRKHIIKVTR